MKIGIAGIGGIGSNVAVHLVRSGFGHLKIIDYDRVERSNLDRQFYFADQIGGLKTEMLSANLLRINPSATIEGLTLRLCPDNMAAVFADCQAVVEGLDRPEDKKHLLEALAGTGLPVVSACGIAGGDITSIRCRRMGGCIVVGDFTSDCGSHRLYAHKVAAVAARMAGEIITAGPPDV